MRRIHLQANRYQDSGRPGQRISIRAATRVASRRRMTAARILVAEDDPASLDLLRSYLESLGYGVGAAPAGTRALEMAEGGESDLLILDVHMPLYEGQEVLHMLRKRLLVHPLKIIAVTADARWALRDEMLADGVDGYLLKPVSLSELGKELTRLLPAKRKP